MRHQVYIERGKYIASVHRTRRIECTLYTEHSTLYTAYNIYTVHCTVQLALYDVQCTPYTMYSILYVPSEYYICNRFYIYIDYYTSQCIPCNKRCIHCIMYSVHCTLYNVQYALCTYLRLYLSFVQCT